MNKERKLAVYQNFAEAQDVASWISRTGQAYNVYIKEKKRFLKKYGKWEIWGIRTKNREVR